MNVFKLLSFSPKSCMTLNGNAFPMRSFRFSSPLLKTDENVAELPVADVLDDLREPELTEEEIMRKRFKARLPERVYRKFVVKEPLPLENHYDFNKSKLRSHYGKFGNDTKLNPGVCWPSRDEMMEIISYEKIFEPPLQDRINKVESEKLAEEQRKREVEAEVDKNMANLDKWVDEYYGKIEKKEAKARELKAEREKLVEEISEYLGYDIDPKDPRFKEAVEQRDKERKKAVKAKKQQESYEKMLEKLRKIAQNK